MRDQISQNIMNRAKRRLGFKIHFLVYASVISMNWLVWLLTWTGYAWPIWPTLGWGIGLAIHFLAVFGAGNLLSVEREYNKLKDKEYV